MKTKAPFPISDFRLAIDRKPPVPAGAPCPNRQSAIGNRQSEKGMALVITLILLAVTLVMAVAFLAISRRERNAVTTTTDTATARLAAESALAAAQAQMAATALATGGGGFNFALLVSTNYQNPNGFDPAPAANPGVYNVNYNYLNAVGNPPLATAAEWEQNIANLWLLPRVPVFPVTNTLTGQRDFRFYLDLNRNGRFETNGIVGDWEYVNGVLTDVGNTTATGDPEWVGVLEHPDQPHGPNNHFIARYAFFAQPAGNSLDLNFIHNETQTRSFNAGSEGYFRNEGVGSWELNLAAFLADLNTNEWGYAYQQTNGFPNTGFGFLDAQSLLGWRYKYNYLNQAPVPLALFNSWVGNGIDGLTLGYLMTGTGLPALAYNAGAFATPWAGANNTNAFFALPSELFDTTNTAGNVSGANLAAGNDFTDRLRRAGAQPDTYDRYTFYRLLSQMGTDSSADPGKMNLNYDNLDANGNVVVGAETNLQAWTPLRFFTNAADRLLRHQSARWLVGNSNYFFATFNTNLSFGISAIPVEVNGRFVYSSAVNRLLQLAANIYDASTNHSALYGKDYPSVFRPFFRVDNFHNVYITGFEDVSVVPPAYSPPETDPVFSAPTNAVYLATLAANTYHTNIFGVPWIVGAKKYMPGFNQFYQLTYGLVSRDLMIIKPGYGAQLPSFTTNQMYSFAITNKFGFSLWNPYTTNFPVLELRISFNNWLTQTLTNDDLGFNNSPYRPQLNFNTNNTIVLQTSYFPNWPGTVWQGIPPNTAISGVQLPFLIPMNVTVPLLTNAVYYYGNPGPVAALGGWPGFSPNVGWQLNGRSDQLPTFGLQTTNRLQVFVLDKGSDGYFHVLDYVHFAGPEGSQNLNTLLADPDSTGVPAWMFSTNSYNGSATPYGVVNQINVSRGTETSANTLAPLKMPVGIPQAVVQLLGPEKAAQTFFNAFYNVNSLQYGLYRVGGKPYYNTNNWAQAPYSPFGTFYNYTTWQANDPLVHYLADDLTYGDPGTTGAHRNSALPKVVLNAVPTRWSPWAKGFTFPGGGYPDVSYLTQVKDSLVYRPDDWDFPTGKYPTVGWLGRVHRGTPWQTVYLKSADIETNASNGNEAWAIWTGDQQYFQIGNSKFYYDSYLSAPTNDADLFDLFTTRFNDNATRGTLSVNQPHLAAWSALLGGMVVLTNTTPSPAVGTAPVTSWAVVDPAGAAGAAAPLAELVAAINAQRGTFVNLDGVKGVFERTGDILKTPKLTEQSPFLNWNDAAQQQAGISDELYEWLPQQMLGLLRVSSAPRYVVYCYGQALRPAPGGTVTASTTLAGGQNSFGLVTNYQVTAESAARAVVRFVPEVLTNNVGIPTGTNYSTVIENYSVLPPE